MGFLEKMKTKLMKAKKGAIVDNAWGLVTIAAILMIAGIFMAFGADITNDVGSDFTAGSYGANITTESLKAQMEVAQKQSTVGKIGIVVIVLGMLMGLIAYTRMSSV